MNKVMHWWMILACLVSFFSSITASQIFILPNNALNRLGQQKNCSCPDIHLYYYQISNSTTTTPGPWRVLLDLDSTAKLCVYVEWGHSVATFCVIDTEYFNLIQNKIAVELFWCKEKLPHIRTSNVAGGQ